MDAKELEGFLSHFRGLEDPRHHHNVMHPMHSMLIIALVAVMCGCEGWAEVEVFAYMRREWFKSFLDLPHGIPSHDTFGRVLGALDPDAFEACFIAYTRRLAQKPDGLINVDGKVLRRSMDRAGQKSPLHMISAWSQANQVVLGQLAIADKNNEITALPKLLELLDIKGATITADAMHCQKQTAGKILEKHAHYLLQVKANQPSLLEDVELFFDEAITHRFENIPHDKAQETDGGHDRVETRTLWCTRDLAWLKRRHDWPGLAQIVCVEAIRDIQGKQSKERRYYLSSNAQADAKLLQRQTRGHWEIENCLHWRLDVSFDEDQCRLRKNHAAENFSRLRRFALNQLKKDKTYKIGIKSKRKACGWSYDYLFKVLTQV